MEGIGWLFDVFLLIAFVVAGLFCVAVPLLTLIVTLLVIRKGNSRSESTLADSDQP